MPGASFGEDADLPCGSQIPFFDQCFLNLPFGVTYSRAGQKHDIIIVDT